MDSGPDYNKTSEHLPGWMIAGRYELVGKLGEGGMGAVFKVRDHKVGKRLIALKRILQLNEHAHERFEREIDSAANLNHRNICKVYDRGDSQIGWIHFYPGEKNYMPSWRNSISTSLADQISSNICP